MSKETSSMQEKVNSDNDLTTVVDKEFGTTVDTSGQWEENMMLRRDIIPYMRYEMD